MAKIHYSRAAIRDLEQIGDYIAEKLRNPPAALNTVDRIQERIDKLAGTPHIGAPLSTHGVPIDGYRFLVCGSYLAFYRADADDVYIDRILYGKRDYLRMLFGKCPEEQEE